VCSPNTWGISRALESKGSQIIRPGEPALLPSCVQAFMKFHSQNLLSGKHAVMRFVFFLAHHRSSGDHIRPQKNDYFFPERPLDPRAIITPSRGGIPYSVLVLSMV
jgi:hypothetical protein